MKDEPREILDLKRQLEDRIAYRTWMRRLSILGSLAVLLLVGAAFFWALVLNAVPEARWLGVVAFACFPAIVFVMLRHGDGWRGGGEEESFARLGIAGIDEHEMGRRAREALDEVSQAVGFPTPSLLLLRQTSANACIVRWQSTCAIGVTAGMLSLLDLSELRAVFANLLAARPSGAFFSLAGERPPGAASDEDAMLILKDPVPAIRALSKVSAGPYHVSGLLRRPSNDSNVPDRYFLDDRFYISPLPQRDGLEAGRLERLRKLAGATGAGVLPDERPAG